MSHYDSLIEQQQQFEQSNKAVRLNSGKPKMSYIFDAPDAMRGFVQVMQSAEVKYPRNNWKKGRPVSDTIDSLLRHIMALQNGEHNDNESGMPHVDHIVANAVILSQNFHDYGYVQEDQ